MSERDLGRANLSDPNVDLMKQAGLGDAEIARLAVVKSRVDAGKCDDLTIEYKRLVFLKHLIGTGRVSG